MGMNYLSVCDVFLIFKENQDEINHDLSTLDHQKKLKCIKCKEEMEIMNLDTFHLTAQNK